MDFLEVRVPVEAFLVELEEAAGFQVVQAPGPHRLVDGHLQVVHELLLRELHVVQQDLVRLHAVLGVELRQRRVAVGPQVVDALRDGPFRFAAGQPVGALEVSWIEVQLPNRAGSVEVR